MTGREMSSKPLRAFFVSDESFELFLGNLRRRLHEYLYQFNTPETRAYAQYVVQGELTRSRDAGDLTQTLRAVVPDPPYGSEEIRIVFVEPAHQS